MTNLKPVDVAIVGGGWSGLAMAKEITTRTGLNVVVLERGGPRKTSDYAMTMDELDYALRFRGMQNIADETITHRHSIKETAAPVRQYGSFLPGTGVGGSGEHWNGCAFRFLPEIFRLRSHLTQKHGAAKLPADLDVQDWGVSYDELEPYYWYSEQVMGVSGKAGNLKGKIMPGGNPYEAMRQNEYPTPPLKNTYSMDLLEGAAKRLGYHPYTTPAANLSQTYTNPDGVTRPACAYCGYCERFGCMIGAKSQPSNTLLPVLQKQKSFELRTGAWVRRVVHKDGKATGVQYVGANGEEFFQPAGIVVLASFTLSNVRLLALSKIGTQYDPVSRKGTLGRYLTHQVDYGTKVFMPKPLNIFMGSGALGLRLPDVDGDRVKPEDGVLRGGMIYFLANGNRPIANFGVVPQGSAAKNWGPEWKKATLEWADRVLTVAISGEHLSYRHNFMDLDPTYTDKLGDPLLRFTMDWTDHEHHQRALGARVAAQLGKEMGGKTDEYRPARPKYNVINYQSTHIQGGATMGPTPDISVVNRYSQHWNMQNLWVVGASSFPQNPSHNPTLTVLAAAYWAADALIKRYLKNPGKLV